MNSIYLPLSAVAVLAMLSGCSKEPESSATEDDNALIIDEAANDEASGATKSADMLLEELASEDAPEASGDEKFFGKRAFTIVSTQEGVESGSVVEHVRDWGRMRAEIKNTSISMAGFSQDTNQRIIYNADEIVTIDETSGAVTTSTNPLYNQIVARMKGKSGVEFGKEMMQQMGGELTGEKGRFAGHDCEYWEVASMGGKFCVAPWGGALHTSVDMMGVSMEKTATEVRMNDGGPDAAFEYDASKAQAAPDINEIMKQLNPG